MPCPFPIPSLTPREALAPVPKGKARAVIGMRRAGKTTFLFQCLAERLERGIDRRRLVYLNFEDERLAGLEAIDLGVILDEYYREHPEFGGEQTVTWCFDEIQVVPGWERFVRRVLDSERVEVFLSGSQALPGGPRPRRGLSAKCDLRPWSPHRKRRGL